MRQLAQLCLGGVRATRCRSEPRGSWWCRAAGGGPGAGARRDECRRTAGDAAPTISCSRPSLAALRLPVAAARLAAAELRWSLGPTLSHSSLSFRGLGSPPPSRCDTHHNTRYTSSLARGTRPRSAGALLALHASNTQSRRDRAAAPSTPRPARAGEGSGAGATGGRARGHARRKRGLVMVAGRESRRGRQRWRRCDRPDRAHGHKPWLTGRGVEPIVRRPYWRRAQAAARAHRPRSGGHSGAGLQGRARHRHRDGDTLGADDKAGVAEIMAGVAYLVAHPELPRPTLRVGFTPDEEIGEGATLFDIERFGARCAYTLDGSEIGELQEELLRLRGVVSIVGVDVHPGWPPARSSVHCDWPPDRRGASRPTRSRPTTRAEGSFIHVPDGTAGSAEIRMIVRDFDRGLTATSRCSTAWPAEGSTLRHGHRSARRRPVPQYGRSSSARSPR